MSVLDRAQALFAEGNRAGAVALVEREARAGDGEALFALANWRLFALHGPRDLAAAHALLEQAGRRGSVEAVRIRAHLVANGTGVPADQQAARTLLETIREVDASAAHQLEFLPRMKEPAAASASLRDRLCDDPAIEMIRGLLLPEECRYLIALAEPDLQPSFVVDPRDGRRIPHPVRTSFGMNFGPTKEDLVVNALNRRIADATGTEAEWGEPLHVLRYAPGQEYRPHVDALPAAANQRVLTALVYLNDDYRGGETEFPDLQIIARGNAGDALVFRNVADDGRPHPGGRHAGLPVTAGVKWLASRWIRQGPFHPWAD